MDESLKRDRFLALYLFLFFISLYLLTSTDNSIYHSYDSQIRYEVTKSIVERSDLSIAKGVRGVDGRDYSWFGLGQSLLAVPFYILAKYIGVPPDNIVATINQIVGALTVVLVFIFTRFLGYSHRPSLIVAFVYGTCTMAWPMAKQSSDHLTETFFVLLSLYYMCRYVRDKISLHLFMSAVSVGYAFVTRNTSLMVVPFLFGMAAVYHFRSLGFKASMKVVGIDFLLFFTAFLPFLCLSIWYNYYRFGSIFETGYSLIATRTQVDFFSEPFLRGFFGLIASPSKGFFYYSPVAILFFFSAKPFARRHPELFLCLIGIITSYLLLFSKYIFWHSDWAWGPRFIFILTPFFIIPIAEIFYSEKWLKKNISKVVLCFILLLSLTIQVAAVSVSLLKYSLYLKTEGIQTIKVFAEGTPPVVLLPSEIHFDYKRSQILAQFRFIYEIGKGGSDYKGYSSVAPPADIALIDKMKIYPYFRMFDFWWVYAFYNGIPPITVLPAVYILLFLIFISGYRIVKLGIR